MKRERMGGSNIIKKGTLRYLPAAIALALFFLISLSYSDEDKDHAGPVDPKIREFVHCINAQRKSIGCPKLKWDDRIAVVAQRHSRDMVSRDFFNHNNPDGKDPFDRLEEANLGFSRAAENIAFGIETGKELFEIWLRNPSHRRHMLDCRFTRHGVGRAGGHWTQLLLRP
jgi:hypothetical protein